MHIIALEDELTSLRGGQQMNLFEICQGLSQRGHRVSLIYNRHGNLLEQYQQFCDHLIQIKRYGFNSKKIGEVISFLPALASLARVPINPNTIVLSNSCHPAFFGYLLSRYRKLPLICYLQTPTFSFNRQKKLGLSGVKQFITVSNQLKQYWMEFGYQSEKIQVVHNGTDLKKFQPAETFSAMRKQWGIPLDMRVICYVGRLDKEKGVDVLIRAFAQIYETDRNIKLLIAGKSVLSKHYKANSTDLSAQAQASNHDFSEGQDYQQFLEQLVVDLGIEKSVQFLGHVSDPTALYQVSDVAAAPSLWLEAFGRVITEAMACGTPVVATRTGGIPEILTGEFQDHLVEIGNVQQLATTLRRVMAWRETDPTLGQRCREHILQRFSLEKMVDGIEKVLLKVANDE